jgi:YopX protein
MSENKRIIKFRGKPADDRKHGIAFVYGSLVQAGDGVFIIEDGTDMGFVEPDYHKVGMGCGLEDRGITDRYEAMAHGFQEGVERCERNHPALIEVDPETVGQFTGLLDHSDPRKEIFEGDIVLVNDQGTESVHQVVYGIEYDYPAFDLKPSLEAECNELQHCVVVSGASIKIIGNLYQDKELLNENQL